MSNKIILMIIAVLFMINTVSAIPISINKDGDVTVRVSYGGSDILMVGATQNNYNVTVDAGVGNYVIVVTNGVLDNFASSVRIGSGEVTNYETVYYFWHDANDVIYITTTPTAIPFTIDSLSLTEFSDHLHIGITTITSGTGTRGLSLDGDYLSIVDASGNSQVSYSLVSASYGYHNVCAFDYYDSLNEIICNNITLVAPTPTPTPSPTPAPTPGNTYVPTPTPSPTPAPVFIVNSIGFSGMNETQTGIIEARISAFTSGTGIIGISLDGYEVNTYSVSGNLHNTSLIISGVSGNHTSCVYDLTDRLNNIKCGTVRFNPNVVQPPQSALNESLWNITTLVITGGWNIRACTGDENGIFQILNPTGLIILQTEITSGYCVDHPYTTNILLNSGSNGTWSSRIYDVNYPDGLYINRYFIVSGTGCTTDCDANFGGGNGFGGGGGGAIGETPAQPVATPTPTPMPTSTPNNGNGGTIGNTNNDYAINGFFDNIVLIIWMIFSVFIIGGVLMASGSMDMGLLIGIVMFVIGGFMFTSYIMGAMVVACVIVLAARASR